MVMCNSSGGIASINQGRPQRQFFGSRSSRPQKFPLRRVQKSPRLPASHKALSRAKTIQRQAENLLRCREVLMLLNPDHIVGRQRTSQQAGLVGGSVSVKRLRVAKIQPPEDARSCASQRARENVLRCRAMTHRAWRYGNQSWSMQSIIRCRKGALPLWSQLFNIGEAESMTVDQQEEDFAGAANENIEETMNVESTSVVLVPVPSPATTKTTTMASVAMKEMSYSNEMEVENMSLRVAHKGGFEASEAPTPRQPHQLPPLPPRPVPSLYKNTTLGELVVMSRQNQTIFGAGRSHSERSTATKEVTREHSKDGDNSNVLARMGKTTGRQAQQKKPSALGKIPVAHPYEDTETDSKSAPSGKSSSKKQTKISDRLGKMDLHSFLVVNQNKQDSIRRGEEEDRFKAKREAERRLVIESNPGSAEAVLAAFDFDAVRLELAAKRLQEDTITKFKVW